MLGLLTPAKNAANRHHELNLIILTLLLPEMANVKIKEKLQISFCKMLKNNYHHVKELPKRFHLNGHTIGFRPQSQKLEPPCTMYNIISSITGKYYSVAFI